MEKKSLEETAAFIREHRGNENNFAALQARLDEEAGRAGDDYKMILQEIKEKQGADYLAAKETGGTTWPEFEKFASSFEKAVIDALHTAL